MFYTILIQNMTGVYTIKFNKLNISKAKTKILGSPISYHNSLYCILSYADRALTMSYYT